LFQGIENEVQSYDGKFDLSSSLFQVQLFQKGIFVLNILFFTPCFDVFPLLKINSKIIPTGSSRQIFPPFYWEIYESISF